MQINEKKDKLLQELAQIESGDARYLYIIKKGKELPPLSPQQRQDKFLVEGCMSKAWLVPELKNGAAVFYADSEAAIVKGIMAILVEVYSGNPPEQNLGLAPEFLKEGGITEHLSMNRRNGLSNVVKQIMLYSSAYSMMQRSRT